MSVVTDIFHHMVLILQCHMIVVTDFFHYLVRKVREVYNLYIKKVNEEYKRAVKRRAYVERPWSQTYLASTGNQYNVSVADLFICPYNKNHVVRKSRRRCHLYRCKRNAVEPSRVSPLDENWDQPSTVSPLEENWDQPSNVSPLDENWDQPSAVPPLEENWDQPSTVSPLEENWDQPSNVSPLEENWDQPSTVSPLEENCDQASSTVSALDIIKKDILKKNVLRPIPSCLSRATKKQFRTNERLRYACVCSS
jgi:hypothetical protein